MACMGLEGQVAFIEGCVNMQEFCEAQTGALKEAIIKYNELRCAHAPGLILTFDEAKVIFLGTKNFTRFVEEFRRNYCKNVCAKREECTADYNRGAI